MIQNTGNNNHGLSTINLKIKALEDLFEDHNSKLSSLHENSLTIEKNVNASVSDLSKKLDEITNKLKLLDSLLDKIINS
jgi:predicted  nucleic acid-binding Zn-ribbon protein